MIKTNEIIVYNNISCDKVLLNSINKIAEHTKNTWQTNRNLQEIIKDTTIGKIAEFTLRKHIMNNSTYVILDYDDFRINNYHKHAPLDCIFYDKNNTFINKAIEKINNDVINNPYGFLSNETKSFLKQSKIFTMEIKSTRISDRLKDNNKINLEKILNDDFLAYPAFCRKLSSNIIIDSWQKYYQYCLQNNKINTNCSINQLKNIELNNMYDYYARIYVDEINDNLFNVFLIGYTSKNNFIKNSTIKRMAKLNKSQEAIYIAMPLKNGNYFKK